MFADVCGRQTPEDEDVDGSSVCSQLSYSAVLRRLLLPSYVNKVKKDRHCFLNVNLHVFFRLADARRGDSRSDEVISLTTVTQ